MPRFVLLLCLAAATLAYEQTFEKRQALAEFVFTDPAVWAYGDGSLDLVKQSDYKPPHRSPFNIALLADRQFGSFTLEVDLMQTGAEYGHRDMCVIFNFVDPAHFYYVHIASRTDDRAHNIFIVNGADRKKISTQTTDGFDWGKGKWQKVKVVRDAKSGAIEIYVNGDKLMAASDKTFTDGHVGFGSFDDTGRMDNIRIEAEKVGKEKMAFFKRK